jgi:hypothetical protein
VSMFAAITFCQNFYCSEHAHVESSFQRDIAAFPSGTEMV